MVGHTAGDGKSDVGNAYGDALVPFVKTQLEKIPAFDAGGDVSGGQRQFESDDVEHAET
jgi:hypothetical protein